MNNLWKKLLEPRIWKRIYIERLGEPLIYNLAALGILLFGSTRRRIEYDLVPRQPYAFSILAAADLARRVGIDKITIIEFGVAAGAGLLNMCWIAEKITKETGVAFEIVGFDSGVGLPPPRSYRDHPEKYFTGDYPTVDKERLLATLPSNARIYFGEIPDCLKRFRADLDHPIGFVSVDVDYYWSTKECLELFTFDAECFLSHVYTYFDDLQDIDDNEYCGEWLALREFNEEHPLRKITRANMLPQLRVFKNAVWPRQIFLTHIFDHPRRSIESIQALRRGPAVLSNPYL